MTLSSQHWGLTPKSILGSDPGSDCFSLQLKKRKRVSMPSTGLLPFLLSITLLDGNTVETCQCPQRAYFHFYSIESQLTKINSILCQCPQRAYFHFYYEAAYIFDQYEVCQCPQRAYFHFYGSLSEPLILLASESYFYK